MIALHHNHDNVVNCQNTLTVLTVSGGDEEVCSFDSIELETIVEMESSGYNKYVIPIYYYSLIVTQ